MPFPNIAGLQAAKESLVQSMDFEGAAVVREAIVALGGTSDPVPDPPAMLLEAVFPLDGVRAIGFRYPADIARADIDHFAEFLAAWKKRLPGQSVAATEIQPSTGELAAYRSEGRIAAIKRYRDRTGVGLKEAKDTIDHAAHRLGLTAPTWPPLTEAGNRPSLMDATGNIEE